jgi:hypothetical protein
MLLFDGMEKDLCVEKQEYADHLVILIWRCAQLRMRLRYLLEPGYSLKMTQLLREQLCLIR